MTWGIIRGFEWDQGNADKSLKKHGLNRQQIESAFAFVVLIGPAATLAEERYIAILKPPEGIPLFAVFTLRGNEGGVLVRVISARRMHRKEIERYEKENP